MVIGYYKAPIGELRLAADRGALTSCHWVNRALNRELAAYENTKISEISEYSESEGYSENSDYPATGDSLQDRAVLELAMRQLGEYFAGKRREFSVPLSIDGGIDEGIEEGVGEEPTLAVESTLRSHRPQISNFRRRVWRELQKIEYGQTLSYAELARRINAPRSYRAVAMACSKNPLCLFIPCHRIIASNGSLGGYSAFRNRPVSSTSPTSTAALSLKQYLLNLEFSF